MLNHRNTGIPLVDQDRGDVKADLSPRVAFSVIPPTPGSANGAGDPDGCRLVELNLSAYQDDELDPEMRGIIDAHLTYCSQCAANLDALSINDESVQREWRESAPLPSSLEVRVAIDAIMDALPPAAEVTPEFAPKRVHARNRWIRFTTGLASILTFGSLMWSSYRMGYADGRLSHAPGNTIQTPVNPGGYQTIRRNLPKFTPRSTASMVLSSYFMTCRPLSNF